MYTIYYPHRIYYNYYYVHQYDYRCCSPILSQIFVDLIDFPIFLAGVLAALPLYRTGDMWSDLQAARTRMVCRLIIGVTLFRVFFDLFVILPCLLLLTLTGYRLPGLCRRLHARQANNAELTPGELEELELERRDARVKVLVGRNQKMILEEFRQLLMDLPFILMYALTLVTVIRAVQITRALMNR